MRRRITAFTLALLMLLSLLPVNTNIALAADEYTFTITDGTNAIADTPVKFYETVDEVTSLVATGTTDAEGKIAISNLQFEDSKEIINDNTYDIECHGYKNSTVTINDTTENDLEYEIILEAYSQITISGTVQLPEGEGENRYAGINIALYEKISDSEEKLIDDTVDVDVASGTYSFENVIAGYTYIIKITADNNAYEEKEIEVNLVDAEEDYIVPIDDENILVGKTDVELTFPANTVVYIEGTEKTIAPTDEEGEYTIEYALEDESLQNIFLSVQNNKNLVVSASEGATVGDVVIVATLSGADYVTKTVRFTVKIAEKTTNSTFDFVADGITNTEEYEVAYDGAFDATANVTEGSATGILYKSNNEAVVKFDGDDGKVTIVGVGTATITATLPEQGDYEETTISLELTVTPIAQKEISFKEGWSSDGESSFEFGKNNNSYNFEAESLEDGATISYDVTDAEGNSILDPDIIEISSTGIVTVKKVGTYKVVAIATKPNYNNKTIEHTLEITNADPQLKFNTAIESFEDEIVNGTYLLDGYNFVEAKLQSELLGDDVNIGVTYGVSYSVNGEDVGDLGIVSVANDGTVTFNKLKAADVGNVEVSIIATRVADETYKESSTKYSFMINDWEPENWTDLYKVTGTGENGWYSVVDADNPITVSVKDSAKYVIYDTVPSTKDDADAGTGSILKTSMADGIDNTISFCIMDKDTGFISKWYTVDGIKVDKVTPSVLIKEYDSSIVEWVLSFFKGEKTFEVEVTEDPIGSDKTTYYWISDSTTALSESDIKAINNWQELDGTTVTLSNNTKGVIYVKVQDEAGNTAFANTKGLIADNTLPEVTISVPEATNGYYTEDFDITVDVTEQENLSGIKDVYYWIGEQTDANKQKFDIAEVTKDTQFDQLLFSVSDDITVDADLYNTTAGITVYVQAVDNAGNESELKELHYNIYKGTPSVSVSYDNNSVITTENGINCYDEVRNATVTIESRYDIFDKSEVEILVNNNRVDNSTLTWNEIVKTDSQYIVEVNVEFPNSLNAYSFEVKYTDTIGNEASHAKEKFVVDTESPKATITIGNTTLESVGELPSVLTFDLFKKDLVNVTATKVDATSVAIEYYCTNSDTLITESELQNLTDEEWLEYSESGISLDVNENEVQRYTVYFKLVDAFDRTTYISTNGFIIDKKVSDISITATEQPNERGYYKSDVNLTVNIDEYTQIYSGIKSIVYEVSSVGSDGRRKVTQSGSWTGNSVKGVSKDILVNASKNNSKDIIVKVTVTDNAGNESTGAYDSLKIDSVPANFTTTIKNPNATNIYANDVQVNVNITDPAVSSGIYSIRYWIVKKGESKGTTQAKDLSVTNPIITVKANEYDSTNRVYVEVVDNAGNITITKTEKEALLVDIDKTVPKIEVSYTDKDTTPNVVGNKGYFDKERIATITVTERTTHFDKDAFMKNIKITATDAKGKDVANAVPVVTFVKTTEGATENDAKHVFTIKYTADANYTFSASCTDKAGWTCADKSITSPTGTVTPKNFAIDTKAPTGTIKVADLGVWDKLLQTITFGLWSPSDVDIEMTADDVTSPIASIQYYKTSTFTALTKADLDTVTTWTDYSKFSVSKDDIFVIYGKITDNTGHVAYISSNGIVVDETKPVFETFSPEITLSLQQPVNGIYNDDVTVDVKVIDPKKGENNAYSGLKEIRYEVYNMGEKTQSGTLYKFNKEDPTQNQLKQSWDAKDIVVDAEKNNSNKVVVKVFATDNAGNNSNKSVSLKIDMTSPIIEVSYDNNEGDTTFEDNVYYNSKRVATIKVTERNFDASKVKVTITNSDGKVPKISEWTTKKGSGNGDNAVHTAKITYSADGDYTFKISMKDKAGNANKAVKYGDSQAPKAFTIDKTKPVISVSYDNNEAMNDNYYKADRTATITIQEHNFDDSRVEATITATDNGENVAVPSISRWSKSGDTYTATINYTDDAMYTFALAYTDMAGNEAEAIEEQSFYVDKTAPVMSIKGVVDETTNNEDTIGFVITATDTNFDIFTPVLTATVKTENGFSTKELDIAAISKTTNGREYKVSNIDADGIYRITCTLIDKAGNAYTDVTLYEKDGSAYVENRTAEDTLMSFSINRDGSVFEVDKTTSKVLDNYYVYDVKEDITIIEVNANTVSEQSITLNGETLKEGKDYEITTEGGNGNWMRYIYTIDKSLFAEEGEYTIVVSSVDEAENNAFSDVKDTKVSFVVDRTAPVVTISGMETEGRYQTDNQTVTLIPTDDGGAISSIVVYQVDKDGNIIGEPLMPELSGDALMEQMEANDGMIEFNLPSGNYDYIQVVCSDSCVNENGEPNIARILIEDVRISASAASLYMEDLVAPIAIGSVVVLAAIAGIVINKKKKSNKIK